MDIAISCMVTTVSVSSNECMPGDWLLIDYERAGLGGVTGRGKKWHSMVAVLP